MENLNKPERELAARRRHGDKGGDSGEQLEELEQHEGWTFPNWILIQDDWVTPPIGFGQRCLNLGDHERSVTQSEIETRVMPWF